MNDLHKFNSSDYSLDQNWNEILLRMLCSPNICHKQWVFRQYDSMVQTNTAVGPGSDAAILRLRHTRKALAMTTDCNGRFVYLNPRLGASSAVAEAARNIVCAGGRPLAVTNCLNFGNPYKPEIYYQFTEAIAGMGEACRTFSTPVTGGNVSFYNEDPSRAVFPTPTIGMIGLIEDIDHITTQSFVDDGDIILLLGSNSDYVGASEYLHTIFNQTRGDVPPLDLNFEKRLQDTLLAAIQSGGIKSAHDCSEGGLAVALAESCLANQEHPIGATITFTDTFRADALLFGEAQSRIVISCAPKDVAQIKVHFSKQNIPCTEIGKVGGERFTITKLIDLPLTQLADRYFFALQRLMEKVA